MKKCYCVINDYYWEFFGEKIFKLFIDVGFDCFNRDGIVVRGGCIFCIVFGLGDVIVVLEVFICE